MYFTWGVDTVSRNGVNQLIKPEYLGEPVFADNFVFDEQCQTELIAACSILRTYADYKPHIKQSNGLGTVSCFLEEFGAYSVLGSLQDCRSVRLGAWQSQDWQVLAAEVPSLMDGFLSERSCFSDEGQTILNYYQNEIGWDGTNIRFAGIALESSVIDPFSTLPESTVRVEYDAMLEIATELSSVISSACGGDVVMTDLDQKFVFMNNQRIYTSTAVQSSLLGVGIAFVVLLVATRVIHIAVLATLSIAGVLVSVSGMMVMIGWELGSTESVLISIIAGFAVDYVVHLAHSYASANGNTMERIAMAYGEMGISVLNGMITSVTASIPLFFCELTFFRKFGTFMFLTITFSWLFSNFAFMSVLAQLKIPIKSQKKKASTGTIDDRDEQANGCDSVSLAESIDTPAACARAHDLPVEQVGVVLDNDEERA